ncbi:MAG: hypothetical protein DRO11_00975 [Methanobacteriota archaeon]|nr:MAG: hypothetical protein DRO11_00975 [Euryarchaeota archaeon]
MEISVVPVPGRYVGVAYNRGLLANTIPLPTKELALKTLEKLVGPRTQQGYVDKNICFVAKLVHNIWMGVGDPHQLHRKAAGLKIDYSGYTQMEAKVLEAVRRIRPGETKTYGEIANIVGVKRGARFVGSVMAKNLTPLIVPCHRVVAKHGPGGYTYGIGEKLRLLRMERELARC